MKIFLTGGTGFVGRYVAGRFYEAGHEVSILTRSIGKSKESLPWATLIEGDPKKVGEWQQSAAQTDAAINLAGSSIFTVCTDSARKTIFDSRVLTTRNLVSALASSGKDKILISASAVGYYGSRMDDEKLEEAAPHGSEFMSEVCVQWENEAQKAAESGIRVALCRFGIVLGREGGALATMLPAFRYMAGSVIGSGKQWMSWIHVEDLFNIFLLLLGDSGVSGPINCVSPNPVRNAEFAKTLARTLGRPILLPAAPAFLLRTVLGEFAKVLLMGQRVIPGRLLEIGFPFRFPTLQQALEDLIE